MAFKHNLIIIYLNIKLYILEVILLDLIVQKFGGTSVSTKERRVMVVNKIQEAINMGLQVVVVVSAMGRRGDPYATDTLKNLIIEENPNCGLRTLDFLMSCGEAISAAILVSTLDLYGIKAIPMTGYQAGIITDENFGNSEILAINDDKIKAHLAKGEVVIICGFQGITKEGEITTLGRGGSDTSATAIGVALGAKCVEIYTDVDGIMTADPNVVPSAKIIDEINYEEVFQMAEKGAKVIHPRAVEIAQKGSMLVKIKNTMSSHPGTVIYYHRKNGEGLYSTQPTKLLTAITHKDNIAQISILMEDDLENDSILLSKLAAAAISIDMINFFLDRKVFTVENSELPLLTRLLNELNIEYKFIDNCSKVTIVGNRITGIPGVMATIVKALAKEGIRILQSSDSHSTISCLVKNEDAKKALNVLHEAFQLHL